MTTRSTHMNDVSPSIDYILDNSTLVSEMALSRHAARGPQWLHNLHFAVFMDALRDVTNSNTVLRANAIDWFNDLHADDPFSLQTIADTLGLNAAAVRARVLSGMSVSRTQTRRCAGQHTRIVRFHHTHVARRRRIP